MIDAPSGKPPHFLSYDKIICVGLNIFQVNITSLTGFNESAIMLPSSH